MIHEMWSGIFFYGILAISTALFAELSVKKNIDKLRPLFAFLTVFLPSIFAGLRYGIGTDYFSYLERFNQINGLIRTRIDNAYVYVAINKIIGNLGGSFQLVLFILSFITTIFIYLALTKYKNEISVGLGMFVYMVTYYQMSYNVVRQIAALAILLYSIQYINKRCFVRFTVFIIIAAGLHITAIVFYPLYFLNWFYGSSKYRFLKIVSFTGLVILMINFSNMIFPIVSQFEVLSYFADNYLYSTRSFEMRIGIVLRILPLVLPGILLWNKVKQDKRMILLFNILVIGCITLLTAYSSSNYTERISYFFLSAQIIFVPFMYRKGFESGKRYISILVILAIVALWWGDFIYMNRNQTVPYNWILTGLDKW